MHPAALSELIVRQRPAGRHDEAGQGDCGAQCCGRALAGVRARSLLEAGELAGETRQPVLAGAVGTIQERGLIGGSGSVGQGPHRGRSSR